MCSPRGLHSVGPRRAVRDHARLRIAEDWPAERHEFAAVRHSGALALRGATGLWKIEFSSLFRVPGYRESTVGFAGNRDGNPVHTIFYTRNSPQPERSTDRSVRVRSTGVGASAGTRARLGGPPF